MPANAQINVGNNLDSRAINLVPYFGDGGKAGPHWICSNCTLRVGAKPSEATLVMKLDYSNDEGAPSIILDHSSNFSSIKVGTTCQIKVENQGAANFSLTNQATVMTGHAVIPAQQLKKDHGTITIYDHRWLLEGLPVIGAMHVQEPSPGEFSIEYRQAYPCIMNPNGEPNLTLDGGGNPCFCSPRWGLDDANEDPPESPVSGKASYWTPQWACVYFRKIFTSISDFGASLGKFPWLPQVNSNVVDWPDGLEKVFDGEDLGDRKQKTLNFTNKKLNYILQEICESAGPFALYMEPNGGGTKSQIKFVRTRNGKSSSGGEQQSYDLPFETAGDANGQLAKAVVNDGSIREDGTDLQTLFVGSGRPVYIERRLETIGLQNFIPAWSADDEQAVKDFVANPPAATGLTADTTDALRHAFTKYPDVFSHWRIDPNYAFYDGTSESDFPRAEISRPILNELISSYNEDSSGSYTEKVQKHFQVRFEISTDGGTNWSIADESDGLTIEPDGTIKISGLRRLHGGADSTWRGNVRNPEDIEKNDLRVTVAIPCDHSVLSVLKSSLDPTGIGDGEILNLNSDDNDRIASGLNRYYQVSDMTYKKDITKESYPIPESAYGAERNETVHDETDKLKSHMKRKGADFGRLKKASRLIVPHLMVMQPGSMIKSVGGYTLDAAVSQVNYSCGKQKNHTEIICS